MKFYRGAFSPSAKAVLQRLPLVRRVYSGWNRPHPFDLAEGIDASGFLSANECAESPELASKINFYAGSQPSIVRASLASLPDHAGYTFVDIGCGKGRPLAVASEFPFRRIIGVELSEKLVDIARSNAAAIAAGHPSRTPIEVNLGDATQMAPEGERIVFFMYNSLGAELAAQLVANIEHQLRGSLRHAFFVYYNPVFGDALDRSERFLRWSASSHRYAREEVGYGPDVEDSVVIWQSKPAHYVSKPNANRRIRVSDYGWSSLAA